MYQNKKYKCTFYIPMHQDFQMMISVRHQTPADRPGNLCRTRFESKVYTKTRTHNSNTLILSRTYLSYDLYIARQQ